MATYNVDMSYKAMRTFSSGLEPKLVQAHRAVDPSVQPGDIIVILHRLHPSGDEGRFYAGDGNSRRYIRVVIDLQEGSQTDASKQELMRKVKDCCVEYEGTSACEIEVRINEVKPENVLKVKGAGA